MRVCLAILFCQLAAPVWADEAVPQGSLFFSQQDAHQAEILAQHAQPKGGGDINLGAVMYYGPEDWAAWIQGEKWVPGTARDNLHILSVSADEVRLSWRDEDNVEHPIVLKPNQSFEIATGRIVANR